MDDTPSATPGFVPPLAMTVACRAFPTIPRLYRSIKRIYRPMIVLHNPYKTPWALFSRCLAAPAKLHVRTTLFGFARKYYSALNMAAPYVQVRTNLRSWCPDQPGPRSDPNPNPNRTIWGGPRSALEVDRGRIEYTRKCDNFSRTCN